MNKYQGVIKRLMIALLFCSSWQVFAVELAPLFKDHMVMQRGKVIEVRGWIGKSEQIKIQFNHKNLTVNYDGFGGFKAEIPAQKAGGPFILNVMGNNNIDVKDIYFGDVFLASGQSNMEWKLMLKINNWEEEVENSHYPLIRYYDVPNKYSFEPLSKIEQTQWMVASPEVAHKFSAIAWLMARELHLDKNIPIGIIDATWGGTPAEAWTPSDALLSLSAYRDGALRVQDKSRNWENIVEKQSRLVKAKSAFVSYVDSVEKLKVASETYDDSMWDEVTLPNSVIYNDAVWARKQINLSKAGTSSDKVLFSLGNFPQVVQVYVNDTLAGQKKSTDQYLPLKIDASLFKKGKNTVAVRLISTWTNKVRIGKANEMYFEYNGDKILLDGTWRVNSTLEGSMPQPISLQRNEGVLYNAMIHPLINYPLTSVLWYQGESNVAANQHYDLLFKTLIESWRERWNRPELPFVFAQLAGMNEKHDQPTESDWALLREAQFQALSLPLTAMVTLIDAGEEFDIHPRDKQTAAKRFYSAVKGVVYNDLSVYSGPVATKVKANKNKMFVSFKDIGAGLYAEGEILGFELAGSDAKFVNAKAVINGSTIELTASSISKPVFVRYAWADNSNANLYNVEGFPAVPFRLNIYINNL
ncbi:sialate O-acetylesterase [Colwellia sp. UCD-KL20]|uniref:sialate O-acetylesterase n=1 Tax=Colwellia sp. UCD-KL20 TaxID=1917165 RepID=UPI0015C33D98|nr:sialate O-acetylesterase [Colwellia sp. UCD-KL20]